MTRRDKRPRKGGDAADPRPAGGRWRLRNWRLGTKLFAVLLIPALAVIALVGLRISSDLRDARQLAEFATRGRVDNTVAEALHELQRERDLTVRFVAQNRQGDTAELTAQRTRVDQGIGTFERTLADSKPRLDAKAAESLQQTDDRLRVLGGLRFSAEHSAFPADAVLRSYSELISGLLDISDSAAADVADPELARMRLAGNALARIKDQMSVKRAVMAEALAAGTLNRDRTRALLGAEAELAAARSDYRTFATPDQQRMFDDTVIGLVVDIGNDMVESALTRTENGQNLSGLDPNQWDTSATHTVNLAHQVQQALLVQLQERTDSLAAQARTAALWDGGVVLGVLLVAGVLSVVIARSLLRPLRILRRTALEVAEHRLPAAVQNLLTDPEPAPENLRKRLAVAPVPVFTREELGQVARAFDAVHGEAVRLAGEQAMLRENVNAMFVNLSQRSQDLVERQLSVLDRMEADEQDPDTLAGLFELDHLATRMRRNSENLLVLSGNDSAREDAGPVSADEIIGAALSEVEHYQRIELGPAPQVAVRGEAVNDLVHVVSELLENATRYSGEEMVTVASAETHDGDWQIEIIDHGAGMPQAEIDRTNTRLAHPPDVDVEVSRRMGLFVVATLATRHHIDVSLSAGAESGLVATVLVPAALIVELPPMPAPPPPAEPPVAPEPELLAPLAPLTPPEPEPESEPEELTPPSIEAGPPRRAPVVARDQSPEWPTVDDEAHLDLDAPTERMPAYRDVLSRWFDASAAPEQPRKPSEPRPVAEEPRPMEPQPRPVEFESRLAGLQPRPVEFEPGPAEPQPRPGEFESRLAGLQSRSAEFQPRPGEFRSGPAGPESRPVEFQSGPAGSESRSGEFRSGPAGPEPRPAEIPSRPAGSEPRPGEPQLRPAEFSLRPAEPQSRPVEPQPRHALAAPPPPPPPLPVRETPPPAPALSRETAQPGPDDEDTEPRMTPVAPPAAIEPAYEWPTSAELEQEDGAEDTWPFLQPLDSAASPGAVPEQRPILSLSPEAVRERMTSLQGGFRRGRHARGDDTRNQ